MGASAADPLPHVHSESDDEDTEQGDDASVDVAAQVRVRKAFLKHYASGADSRSRLLDSAADTLRALAQAIPRTCPGCGVSAVFGGKRCSVTIVTWEQPVIAEIPVGWCTTCKQGCNLLPVQADCVSDSNSGWDLDRAHSGKNVLWWHQSVLQMYDILSFRTRHLSADAFCDAMMNSWERNGISRPSSVSATTLRQRMREALLLYMDCQNVIEDYPEDTITDWPRGALNSCPCCGDSVTCAAMAVDAGAGPAGGAMAAGVAAAPAVVGETVVGARAGPSGSGGVAGVDMADAGPAGGAMAAGVAAAPAVVGETVVGARAGPSGSGGVAGVDMADAGPAGGAMAAGVAAAPAVVGETVVGARAGPSGSGGVAGVDMADAGPAGGAMAAGVAAAPAVVGETVVGARAGPSGSGGVAGVDMADAGPASGAMAAGVAAAAAVAGETVVGARAGPSGSGGVAGVDMADAGPASGAMAAGVAAAAAVAGETVVGARAGPSGSGGVAGVDMADAGPAGGAMAAATVAMLGAAAVASAWLLTACSPEGSGPGPSCLHSVHFDACFKLNLLAFRGYAAQYTQLARRRLFLPNTLIQQVLADGTASQQIGATHCSNFNADKVLAAESRKNLITAVGAVLCRHGMLLRLMNLFGGERHAYATTAALSLLSAGTAVQFWWYDIACRWGKSYTKWLGRQAPELQQLGAGLRPLIPPWHRYAHSLACQKAFGHASVGGVGQGTGEPAEIFNSVIGPHGGVTQYMSPANREAHLERVCRLYCRDVLEDMPMRLWRMRERAKAVLSSARQRVDDLEAALAKEMSCEVEEVGN
ncbi:hypothetical protein CHLRE_08g373361v5 [Chlamydomonas reinhardtii]|uniref:Uncharacterized protein n=1 Tax=Chlamydomonas reinhardtii TaxID=3055 RepID=A0A2K3DHF0_CHLRE|nr:uncharacterized protein CHLRE_08g373361v5 [Chlamydomonas reinhardtii]PNW79968.1 hypothetical protein CHLRE_08g373361v5 [Chlamydomonas reinhardtii]